MSPVCPMCNKDCGNMPNLRSHLQVSYYIGVNRKHIYLPYKIIRNLRI